MNDNDMVQVKRLPDGSFAQLLPDGSVRPLPGGSDWARLYAMTEAEIEANALADPDNPPISPARLARLRPAPNPRVVRESLHLTQEQFSRQFQLPISTIREWEQGRKTPDSAARVLLRVIAHNARAVLDALEMTETSSTPETR